MIGLIKDWGLCAWCHGNQSSKFNGSHFGLPPSFARWLAEWQVCVNYNVSVDAPFNAKVSNAKKFAFFFVHFWLQSGVCKKKKKFWTSMHVMVLFVQCCVFGFRWKGLSCRRWGELVLAGKAEDWFMYYRKRWGLTVDVLTKMWSWSFGEKPPARSISETTALLQMMSTVSVITMPCVDLSGFPYHMLTQATGNGDEK